MIALSLLSLAHADSSTGEAPTSTFTCPVPSVVGSLPADGAVDVPLDVQPALLLEGCDISGTVELREASGLAVLPPTVLTGESFDGSGGILRVPLVDDLSPDTDYVLTHSTWDLQVTEIGFTTGSAVLGGDGPLAPTLELAVGESQWTGAVIAVPVDLTLSDLAPGTLVIVRSGTTSFGRIAPVSGGFDLSFTRNIQPGIDLCASAEVEDLVGRLSELGRACVTVEVPPDPEDLDEVDERGCRTVSGAPWLGLLVLPLVRRRRR